MPYLSAETAQCADCYAILYQDEMNQCPEGHWVCPGCVCDCVMLSDSKKHLALWTAWDWQPTQPQDLEREEIY